MPLAIAIHETCNALFKGTSVGNCLVKVEGEVVMSFPAAFLPILSSYKPLSFNINAGEKIERVLHNQYLLNKCVRIVLCSLLVQVHTHTYMHTHTYIHTHTLTCSTFTHSLLTHSPTHLPTLSHTDKKEMMAPGMCLTWVH